MSNKHIVSILRPIVEEIEVRKRVNTPLSELKEYIINSVKEHKQMNSVSSQTLIREVSTSPTTISLTRYLWNALLKFEGLATIR